MEAEDEFFEQYEKQRALEEPETGERESLYDRMDRKSAELGQKIDEKLEQGAKVVAKIKSGQSQ